MAILILTTNDKANTLLPESQKVTQRFKDGELRVTTYDNLLAPGNIALLPSARNADLKEMELVDRFIPTMQFNYQYYYNWVLDSNFAFYRYNPKLNKIKNVDSLARKWAASFKLKFSLLRPFASQHVVN